MCNDQLKSIINNNDNIVFFGGAGVSTESSIPDFRSESGLYTTKNNFSYSPEVMLSASFFSEHPEDFFEFYRKKLIYKDAKPNLAHYALAELEKRGKIKAVITQNIDGLHQLAGSKKVLELHGSVHRNYCTNCNKFFDLNYIVNFTDTVPKCDVCNSVIKPDVVLYQERLNMSTLAEAASYIINADVLIVGGTSLVVYPAAGLIDYFKGKHLILINKKSTPYDKKADIIIHDSIGSVLNSTL